jgi:hypothetical protein
VGRRGVPETRRRGNAGYIDPDKVASVGLPRSPTSRAQLHGKQNPNKRRIINTLSRNALPDQRIFKKCVKFSTTQTLEMFNLKQPKPPPQVVPMVRVAKNHNLLIERFACFVTI